MSAPTLSSTWQGVSGVGLTDALLEWPADLFAATNLILDRSEGFRFALAPASRWPPKRIPDWASAVERAGRTWSASLDDPDGGAPDLVAEEWALVRRASSDLALEDLAAGKNTELAEALLTLHAIADEACAGLGVALDTSEGDGCAYRARGRELLAQRGSLSRLDPSMVRVLPKVRTPPSRRPTFSRYVCAPSPGITTAWRKMPSRHRGTDPSSEHAKLLLLPWPLKVRERDFRRLGASTRQSGGEPSGFFEFAPHEGLDLELLDRVLTGARQESGNVDVVVLPESAVEAGEIDALEAVLERQGVSFLHAGVREASSGPGEFGGNWFHIGVNPSFEKGSRPTTEPTAWFHLRQDKLHRWSLDKDQIYQYHLGGVLHPDVRWWEAMEVPRRAVQFMEVAELTLACLVCEDLALSSDIADLIRSVGPTIVMTVLLDGPQLTSRWTARYAGVLADDPGSAVLTLTSYGMAQRSRPIGREASPVVALWKDPARGIREIPLEEGAHGVLLTVCMRRTNRRTADGRRPVGNGTQALDVAVQQIRAARLDLTSPKTPLEQTAAPVLGVHEVTILTAWAEGVAEVLAKAPQKTERLLAEARAGSAWRHQLGLAEPSPRLGEALDLLREAVVAVTPTDGVPTFDALLESSGRDRPGEARLTRLVRHVLLSMLEQRCTREPTELAG